MLHSLLSQMTPETLLALGEVLLIDLTLAGDNALAISLAVRKLEDSKKQLACWCGALFATVVRLALALIVRHLLLIPGLPLLGGLLLFWAAWQSWSDLRRPPERRQVPGPRQVGEAVLQIIVADLAMGMDNVLGVASAARHHPVIMSIGMGLSMLLVLLSTALATPLLRRYRWVGFTGVVLITLIALRMCVEGCMEIWHVLS